MSFVVAAVVGGDALVAVVLVVVAVVCDAVVEVELAVVGGHIVVRAEL